MSDAAAATADAEVAMPTVDEPQVERPARGKTKSRPKRQPPYNVILWNDDDHSYEYVILMLHELFGHPPEMGFKLAQEVDKTGRAIVFTTTLERAELKRDQVHAYGKDHLIASCAGSMRATLEPAPA